jgi:hypothetical protein
MSVTKTVGKDRGCVGDQPQKRASPIQTQGVFRVAFLASLAAAGLRHSRGP